MSAKVTGLFRYEGKKSESLQTARLLEGMGMEGNDRQKGERQLSILVQNSGEPKEEADGLCTRRFKANILIEGSCTLAEGKYLHIGEAVLRVSGIKLCHDGCGLGSACYLTKGAGFAAVEKGGVAKVGDLVIDNPTSNW